MEGVECNRGMLPIRDTLEIVGGKWRLLIIFYLRNGPLRFKQLQREIDGITARMLSRELKTLEINELVTRTVIDTSPVSVIYSLTEHSESLCSVIQALHEWGQHHRDRILRTEPVRDR